MTKASTGLVAALARGGKVLSLAEMTADDILAGVSSETKAALLASASAAASPAPTSGASDDGDPDDMGGDKDKCSKCGEPMKDGKCSKCTPTEGASAAALQIDALLEGVPLQTNASMHERVKAVASAVETDEACKGKAGLALAMLADDDYASLSASGIVKLLGKTPAVAADADAEAGGAMLAAMKQFGNPDTGNASGNANNPSKPAQAANHGWDSIHAEIRERRG